MSEDAAVSPSSKLISVPLEQPLQRGEQTISEVQVRRPAAGELRGISLVALGQLEYDEIERLLPRVTIPPLTTIEIRTMDSGDVAHLGAAAADFLLSRG